MNDKSKFTTKDYLLSIQHLFAMFGATVLVPLLTGLNPSLALFSAGVGTLIFHLCTKLSLIHILLLALGHQVVQEHLHSRISLKIFVNILQCLLPADA